MSSLEQFAVMERASLIQSPNRFAARCAPARVMEGYFEHVPSIHDVSFDNGAKECWRANIGSCWLCPADYFFVATLARNLVNAHALDPLSVVGVVQ